jgi:hypothetical protein
LPEGCHPALIPGDRSAEAPHVRNRVGRDGLGPEPDQVEVRVEEVGVADGVGLLGEGTVVARVVEFSHQAQVLPVEVANVAPPGEPHRNVYLRYREPCVDDQLQEVDLGRAFVVGIDAKATRVAHELRFDLRPTGPMRVLKSGVQLSEVEKIEIVGLLPDPLEHPLGLKSGDIEQHPGDRRVRQSCNRLRLDHARGPKCDHARSVGP